MSKSLATPILLNFHNLIFNLPLTGPAGLFEPNNVSALDGRILIEVLSTKIKEIIANDNP